MNPGTTSFEDFDLTHILNVIDKETQTGCSFIFGSEDSKSSVKSEKSNKLPLPRDLDTDDCIKVYSFCQILQDPECPKSVTLIKDSITEEVRSHSNKEDAVANRYKYCREVIKPFLKDYPQDCPDSEERLIQDAISSASEDFPDYQPCYEFFPTSKAFAGKTDSSDSEKRTSLGLIDRSGSEKPIRATPKSNNCEKKCNTETTAEKAQRCGKVDKSTHCTPKSSKSSCKDMDKHKECPSKSSLNKSCPGIPVKDCSPTKVCTTNECPTKKDPNKSCPLRDCPPKPCPLKGCPPDVCPPKECEPEACPPEHCPDKKCPPRECPLTDGPPPCAPAKCPSLDCKKKSKISESDSKSDCHSKIKSHSAVEPKDEGKKCVVRTEKSKGEVCDGRSSSSLDMKKMLQAHNETLATLKVAMEDFIGKVYKTTQEAVNTITNESTKQMQKFKKCESSNTGEVGENKSAETITSFNFVREVESKDKSDKGTCSKDKNVTNQIIRKVESTISVVSETVVDKIPDKLKPTHKFNDTSSPYDEPDCPKRVSHELIHEPTPVISNSVFTTLKTKICSIFCDTEEKKDKSGSKKSSTSCSSRSSKKEDDDKLIEKLIE